MKKLVLALLISAAAGNFCSAQQNYLDLTPGNGYGIRFWASDQYKIHMGNSSEYLYGPVTDYSIKMNMFNGNGRGWTWGGPGVTPIAALNLLGNMQIAGTFTPGSIGIGTTSPSSKLTIDGIDNYSDGITIQNSASYKHLITGYTDGTNPTTGSALQFKVANNNTGGNAAIMTLKGSGNVGIGTTSPGNWFGGKVLEIADSRPTLKLTAATATDLSTMIFTNGAVNSSSHLGEFHINYQYNQTSADKSLLRFYSYPGGEVMTLQSNGNIGIGTTTPIRPLHINNSGGGIVRLQSTTAIWDIQSDAFYNGNFGVVNYTSGAADATKSFVINGTTGNMGIGTTNPGSYKLAVEGKIGAREVNVIATNPWPDYVFDKNYKLPSLDEIKNYIDLNKHLPEVPSASEVEKNGVDLGKMNALLLKKIEELTLHLIEQQEQIKTLRSEVLQLKK